MSSRKPVAGIGDQIADYPVFIIEVELFDPSNFTVVAIQFVAS
jgi:hypothetical protein